ncbi:MAG TPA: hypothetical protein VKB41_09465 [Steroidobacteraceae bacterium]|nr:hypothetical protein [Steroidobacteraceae bacterium]
MSESRVSRYAIAADAPYFAGHFPGDPVVPGVVILDYVLETISRGAGKTCALRRLDAVKFQSPLRPGEELSVELESLGVDTLRFICRSGTRFVATGVVLLRANATEPQRS